MVRHYGDALFRFVKRMVGTADAEDVMQDALLKIHLGLPRFDPGGSLRAYVYAIARNTVRDHWKYASRRRTVDVDVEAAVAHDPGADLERDARWRAVMAAVRELPPDQREVFLLREEGDLSFKEIAELTGAPINTVLGRMHYAVQHLKAKLDGL